MIGQALAEARHAAESLAPCPAPELRRRSEDVECFVAAAAGLAGGAAAGGWSSESLTSGSTYYQLETCWARWRASGRCARAE